MKQIVFTNQLNGPGLDFLATDEEILLITRRCQKEKITFGEIMGYSRISIRLWHDHPGFQCTIPYEPHSLHRRRTTLLF